ncbi:CLUMA_CG008304, isoform A [Clunio marinus]|uniref:CLUMA_CG008304, isoform A n=1 Tax=Clunio marinus TaxID=568069 RepID=A0A1J1I4X2_9DIPT|nr:CLUMA_CG008304, isoform A [Clunio marinus]
MCNINCVSTSKLINIILKITCLRNSETETSLHHSHLINLGFLMSKQKSSMKVFKFMTSNGEINPSISHAHKNFKFLSKHLPVNDFCRQKLQS